MKNRPSLNVTSRTSVCDVIMGYHDATTDGTSNGSSQKNTLLNEHTSKNKQWARTMSAGRQRCHYSKDVRLYREYRNKIVTIYIFHFTIILATLILGMIQNGGRRKYVSVHPERLATLLRNTTSWEVNKNVTVATELNLPCFKAYVDAYSLSKEDFLAAVCCSKDNSDSTSLMNSVMVAEKSHYQSNLCFPQDPIFGISMQKFPFAIHLTRFPEAWVIPLIPIFIRLGYQLVVRILISLDFFLKTQTSSKRIQRAYTSLSYSGVSSSSSFSRSSVSLDAEATLVVPSSSVLTQLATPDATNHRLLRATFQRLIFYILLLNFRGWGLYIGANAIEDYIIIPWITGNRVTSSPRTDTVSDVEHIISNPNHQCWYNEVLKAHQKSSTKNSNSDCYGRAFDFSDHVVLFLSQYLSVILMEFTICWIFPFWESLKSEKDNKNQFVRFFFAKCCAYLEISLFLYFHLIILHATYHTAAYFHTPWEILVGFAISCLLNIPLMCLICSERWITVRRFIGLPSQTLGYIWYELSEHKED